MSKAILKYIRLSPTKARLVAREIQGMSAEVALASLEFSPNKASRIIGRVLASAIANGSFDPQEVIVKSARVDRGPVLRRFMARARARSTAIRKPTSHIFIEVAPQNKQNNVKKNQAKEGK
ncbi:MAG: 50S ribosomal protein L22 [Helicobacter sp.]|nr:50S ribosomal protein L22 [Helicobacter sp.]